MVTKAGNIWLVKSTQHFLVRNPVIPATQLPTSIIQRPLTNPRGGPHMFTVRSPVPIAPSLPAKLLQPTNQCSVPIPATQEGTPPSVEETTCPVVKETPFPASQLLSQFTATTAKKQKPAPFTHTVENVQVPQPVQVAHSDQPPVMTQATPAAKGSQVATTVKAPQAVQIHKTASAPQVAHVTQPIQLSGNIKKASSNPSLNTQKTNKPIPEIPTAPSLVPSNQLMAIPAVPFSATPPVKNVSSGQTQEDPKVLSKTIPSLCVVVRPANAVPDAVNSKKREALGESLLFLFLVSVKARHLIVVFFSLDSFVKSRLVLDARRFAEWLMQVGLLRSQQFGLCRTHSNGNPTPVPLQLRMYAEENKFPYRLAIRCIN